MKTGQKVAPKNIPINNGLFLPKASKIAAVKKNADVI